MIECTVKWPDSVYRRVHESLVRVPTSQAWLMLDVCISTHWSMKVKEEYDHSQHPVSDCFCSCHNLGQPWQVQERFTEWI